METQQSVSKNSLKNKISKAFNIVAQVSLVFYYTLGPAMLLAPQKTMAATEKTAKTETNGSVNKVTPVWPSDGQWIAPTCNDDPSGDEHPGEVDLKASGSQYGAAYFADANNVYIRERVDDNPGTVGSLHQYAWVFIIQKDTSTTNYDYLLSLRGSGAGENVELWQNTTQNGPINFDPLFNDPAETLLDTWSTLTNARVTTVGTPSDYYVDWQIPITELTSRGVNLQTDGLYFATSTNSNNYNKDHLNCYNAPSLSLTKQIQKNHTGPWFIDGRTSGIQAEPGDVLTYRVTLTNAGGPATNVVLADELGKGGADDGNNNINPAVQYSDWLTVKNLDSDGNGNTFTGNWGNGTNDGQPNDTLTATIAMLAGGGASESFTFDTTVRSDLSVGTYLFENTVCGSACVSTAETDIEVVVTPPPLGSLQLTKVVDSGNASADAFSFTIAPDPNNVGTVHTTGGVYTFTNLPAGNYTVTESAYPNYHQVSTTCQSVAVPSGGQASCVIHNTHDTGTITLQKVVQGGSAVPADWSFSISNVPGTFHSGDQVTLFTGDYTVTETGPDGYTLTGASGICSSPSGLHADLSVTTQGGTCTFTNTRDTGLLTIHKNLDTDGDGDIDEVDPPGWTYDIQGGEQDIPMGQGRMLDTGNYTISEDQQPNYNATSWICYRGTEQIGSGTGGTLTVDLTTAGAVCSFTNTRRLTQVGFDKVVVGGGPGNDSDWTFTLFGQPGSYHDGSTVMLPTNTNYEVLESSPYDTLYTLTGASGACHLDNGHIILQTGEQGGTCVIENTRKTGRVTFQKIVNLGNPDSWTFTVDGHIYNNGESVDLPTGSYNVTESGPSGYTNTNVSGICEQTGNGTGTLTVTVDGGTCTFTNTRDTGLVTLEKIVQGGTALPADWDFVIDGVPGTYHSGDAMLLPTGNYTITETGPDGYTMTGASGICSTVTGSARSGGSATLVVTTQGGTCTFTNTRDTGSILVNKQVDTNGDGIFEGGNTEANALGFRWGYDANPTNLLMGSTEAGIPTGSHDVNEYVIPGYHFVGWYSNVNTSATPVGCAHPQGTTLPVQLNVVKNGTATITLCNAKDRATLTVIKHVINDNGGSAVASNFTMEVSGTNVSDSEFPGDENGTTITLDTGAYSVDEQAYPGYTKTIGSDCAGTLVNGDHKTCTITNDDQQAYIIVDKTVVNDNGGSAVANDFLLTVDGNAVLDQVAYPVNPGAHTAGETNLPGYTAGSWGGDCAVNGAVTVALGETKTCTITNDDQTAHLTLVKEVTNDNGGNALAIDWTLSANGPTPISGPGGVESDVNAGTYDLNETGGPSGYIAGNWNCVGEEQDNKLARSPATNQVTLVLGESAKCTIVNDDVAPTITLEKQVNGGDAGPNDFGLTIGGTSVLSGVPLTVNANTAYALNEAGLAGYSFVSITGNEKCPDVLGGEITLDEGENLTCTITNTRNSGSITVNKQVDANGDGIFEGQNNEANALGFFWGIDDEKPTVRLMGSSAVVDTGYHTITENNVLGYHFVGWYQNEGSCIAPEGTEQPILVNMVESTTVTLCNARDTGQLTVRKQLDTDGDGSVDVTDPIGWTYDIQNGEQNIPMGDARTLTTGTYTISEDQQADYTATSWVCNSGVEQISNGSGETLTIELNSRNNYECTFTNTRLFPVLTLTKTVDTTTVVNPGDEVNYTITVKNIGYAAANNLVLKDVMPTELYYSDVLGSNRTFVSGGTLAVGDTLTFTYPVTVKTDTADGNYVNTASLTSDNYKDLTAQATIKVTNGAVKGDTAVPKLKIEKSVDVSFANPGDTVTYTVKITNIGEAPTDNLVLSDILPTGFSFVETGGTTRNWDLGTLAQGKNVTVKYEVDIATSVKAGHYENIAIASADNADDVTAKKKLEVKMGSVMGDETGPELPKTGAGLVDYLIFGSALLLLAGSAFGLRRATLRPVKNNPK